MAKKSKFSKAQYMKWYESMLMMRKFEEKLSQLYIQRKSKSFLSGGPITDFKNECFFAGADQWHAYCPDL